MHPQKPSHLAFYAYAFCGVVALLWEGLPVQTGCHVGPWRVTPDQVPVPRKLTGRPKEREPVQSLPEPWCWEVGLEQEEQEAVGGVDLVG